MPTFFLGTEDTSLTQLYIDHHYDRFGLNLIIPKDITIPAKARAFLINFQILGKMVSIEQLHEYPYKSHYEISYHIYEHPNILKTSLRLSLSPLYISEGESDNIVIYVDNLDNDDVILKKGEILFQIRAPSFDRESYNCHNIKCCSVEDFLHKDISTFEGLFSG